MFFYAGLTCLFIGGVSLFVVIFNDMAKVRNKTKAAETMHRLAYQQRIRQVIMFYVNSDAEVDHEDLQWHLHSLLYEYRTGRTA